MGKNKTKNTKQTFLEFFILGNLDFLQKCFKHLCHCLTNFIAVLEMMDFLAEKKIISVNEWALYPCWN